MLLFPLTLVSTLIMNKRLLHHSSTLPWVRRHFLTLTHTHTTAYFHTHDSVLSRTRRRLSPTRTRPNTCPVLRKFLPSFGKTRPSLQTFRDWNRCASASTLLHSLEPEQFPSSPCLSVRAQPCSQTVIGIEGAISCPYMGNERAIITSRSRALAS